jgi:hypothetical protein
MKLSEDEQHVTVKESSEQIHQVRTQMNLDLSLVSLERKLPVTNMFLVTIGMKKIYFP